MVKIVLILMVVAVAAVLTIAVSRPNDFRVERSTVIKGPASNIYPLISDFRRWGAWSPWEKIDPSMQRTFGGAQSGVGATYAWAGVGKAGAGRMEITQAADPSTVVIKLDFIKPFEGHNVATYTLQPDGDGTRVTWVMDGPRPFISKLMGVFFNMDTMIGRDFEAGLANMKAVAERAA